MSATIYIDLRGIASHEYDSTEHVEGLADHVSNIVRGMGLTHRTLRDVEKNRWPGNTSHTKITENGDFIRLSSDGWHVHPARRSARTLADFLLANGWQKSLYAVFVIDDTLDKVYEVHGPAHGLISLAEALETEWREAHADNS